MNGLLDYLVAEVSCVYISDLKNTCCRSRVLAVLMDLEAERFSLMQWTEAASYIFNADRDFQNVPEVKEFLASLSNPN